MKLRYYFGTILLLCACAYAQEATTIIALQVDDAWAGQVFRLHKSSEKSYTLTHEIRGSGIPVVSSETYPVIAENDSTFHFTILKESKELHLSITKRFGTYQLYLEGLQLQTVYMK